MSSAAFSPVIPAPSASMFASLCSLVSFAMVVFVQRAQRIISARLIIGYADNQYHAWTQTKLGGTDELFDPTAALNAITPVKNYSIERYY